MRIAFFVPDLRGGGVERVRLLLAHEFLRRASAVDLVLMRKRGVLLRQVPDGARIVDLSADRVRRSVSPFIRYLRSQRPDAVLVSMWPLTVIAPLAAQMARYRGRMLVSEHNALSVQYAGHGRVHRAAMRTSMSLGYRLADVRVAVSAGVATDLARLSGLPRERFDVVYNPVAPRAEPSPAALQEAERLWSAPRGARVLAVGSLKAQKNHSLLLDAFARLDLPNKRLLLLGEGSLCEALTRQAHELGIADAVVFAGFHADPAPFYATADLFVLSSDYEGFGNVIVEALAAGTPVVSTDCPSGPAEILEDGRWGQLVPVRDVAALAAAMQDQLRAPHDVAALRQRALDFLPQVAADRYLELLFPSREHPHD